jgi:hypothetical protein
MVGQGKPQPQPPSPQAASAPLFFLPVFFFGVVVVVGAGAAVDVLAGVAAGAATAAGVGAAAFVADAASPEVVDSVAGLASALASFAASSFLAPQAPFAAQLALAPLPSPLGTSVAGELAWLPAHALSTAPEPMTAKAAANLLIFMIIFSLWFLVVRCSPPRRRDDSCLVRTNIALVSPWKQK